MSVPISNGSSYMEPSEFMSALDPRLTGKLCSLAGLNLTPEQLETSPVLLRALGEASGMIEAYALKGEKYTAADLMNLQGNGKYLLTGLVAGLTIINLCEFRIVDLGDWLTRIEEKTRFFLSKLENGEAIFGMSANAEAGVFNSAVETAYEVETRFLSTAQAYRLFGLRNNQANPWVAGGYGNFGGGPGWGG